MHRCRHLLVWLGLAVPVTASAQVTLTVVVRDSASGEVVRGAEVIVDAIGRSGMSDENGRAVLRDLPRGRHVVTVRAIGFRPVGTILEPGEVAAVTREFHLVREVPVLDSITVRGRVPIRGAGVGAEGFEDRRRLGFGRFIDSTTLRANEHRDLPTLMSLAGIDHRGGVPVGQGPYGRRCPMSVYLDGHLLGRDVSLRSFTVFSVQAIEAYRRTAQIPAHFRRLDQQCGVLLLWTRR